MSCRNDFPDDNLLIWFIEKLEEVLKFNPEHPTYDDYSLFTSMEFKELVTWLSLDSPYNIYSLKYNEYIPIERCKIFKTPKINITFFEIPKFHFNYIFFIKQAQNYFTLKHLLSFFYQRNILCCLSNLWGYIFCNINIKKNLNISISPSHQM